MKDRIKQYIDYKSISAGELSSRLDVQRSNISHILNGRNKPGAAFIEKMLLNFSDLDARWLLTGVGDMIENAERKDAATLFSKKEVIVKDELNDVPREIPKEIPYSGEDKIKGGKPIDKVVILFTDGTFKDFDRK
jgi:transcriptional regulator with XRE-family HTH domain